jgi:putative DNA methylase
MVLSDQRLASELPLALNAQDGGGEAAARLVSSMGSKAADARALAYRLYEIASQKGWSAEALVYNELAQEWPKLEELATRAGRRRQSRRTHADSTAQWKSTWSGL